MKTALVTGASRGIGEKIAERFAQEGYAVAINYNKSKNQAETLRDKIRAQGGTAEVFCADVSDDKKVHSMVDEIVRKFGTIDVLINNAGIALKQGLFTDFSGDEIKRVFETDVYGIMNCSKAVVPLMVKNKRGKIVNISSIWGVCGGSCEVIYSSAKAAVIGFTKALSRELAPSGINVNCIAPGLIETDMNSHLSYAEIAAFCSDIPLGRVGSPWEIADAALFLASDKASYITGQTLIVDGGMI